MRCLESACVPLDACQTSESVRKEVQVFVNYILFAPRRPKRLGRAPWNV